MDRIFEGRTVFLFSIFLQKIKINIGMKQTTKKNCMVTVNSVALVSTYIKTQINELYIIIYTNYTFFSFYICTRTHFPVDLLVILLFLLRTG